MAGAGRKVEAHRARPIRDPHPPSPNPPAEDTATKHGIPVTTPDYPSLAALARALPRHRGANRLLATLDRYEAGTTLTRSGLDGVSSRISLRSRRCSRRMLLSPARSRIVRAGPQEDCRHPAPTGGQERS